MNTVRFRLNNEQLPQPTAPSSYSTFESYLRTQKESECADFGKNRRSASPNFQTCAKESSQASGPLGSGDRSLLQPIGSTSAHIIPTVQQYSGGSKRQVPIQTMDSPLLHYSPKRVHKAADYKSIHEEFHNGRLERPNFDSAERLRPISPQHDLLGRPAPSNSLLYDATDTDLCLSMVNETRPSYQLKTHGKQPLTPDHLTALFNKQNSAQQTPYAQNTSKFSSSTYSTNTNLTSNPANRPTCAQSQAVPPAPPPPPSLSAIKASFSGPRVNSPIGATTMTRAGNYAVSSSSSNRKPVRTFEEFDLDDVLGELKSLSTTNTTTSWSPKSPKNSPVSHPVAVPVHKQYDTDLCQFSIVSPKARGLAPAPTDQPVRFPAKYGIEANVDAMTIRMLRNMETGYGAAGTNNCSKCGEGILADRPGCIALNRTFHTDCFTCNTCHCKLSGSPFYSVDDKQYCETDYIQTLDKCVSCGKPIKDRILRASGKAYHPQCFVCASCFRELDNVPFTVDPNGVNYCLQCFHEKFAPRCAACHKPIAPEEGEKEATRVVALDRSYHLRCYVCEDCGLQLSSAIEGHGCYPLDNHLLCKNCNTSRIRKLTEPK